MPSRGRLLASGVGFGLLFHVYFYFWTSACLGLALAWLLDAGHRRVYFHTGWIGGLIGLPAIVAGAMLKKGSPEWLHRTDNFLPIARLSELEFPKLALVAVPLTFAWVMLRRRDLLHLWALTLAGLLLLNHQVVTGLQIQNFHWTYVWGPGDLAPARPARLGRADAAGPWPPALASALLRWPSPSGGRRRALAPGVRGDPDRLDGECVGDIPRLSVAAARPRGRPAGARTGSSPGTPGFVAASSIFENQRSLAQYPAMYSPAHRRRRVVPSGSRWRPSSTARAGPSSNGAKARGLAAGWGPWSGDRDPALRSEELARRLRSYDAVAADPAEARSAAMASATWASAPAPPCPRSIRGVSRRRSSPAPPGTSGRSPDDGPGGVPAGSPA